MIAALLAAVLAFHPLYGHLPDSATCHARYTAADRLYCDIVRGQYRYNHPWQREQELAMVAHYRDVWQLAYTLALCDVDDERHRAANALCDLVGPAAYYSGRLPWWE